MLAGSLTEFSIPDIFSLLAATHKTGVLNLTGSEASGRVWITNGALAHAVADVTRAPLAARLLHGGEVDLDTVEPLVRAQAAEGTQVAEVLASAGIHIDRVHQLLHDQIVDAVFDLSRWSDGTFAFDAQMGAVQGTAPAIPANEVLEAVAARIAEWDGIVAQLPSPASVLVPVSRPPLQSGGMVQLSPAQWEVFTLADGLRSVGDIIALTGQGQFVVARLLASLVADGVLAVTDRTGEQPLSQQRA
ncbi:MAG TPA: DUF4388 domain-containing protein, partial [Euzebya sp.]|nr:DUF4388 domain-containing protein [Euzebya sp.]